MDVSFAEQVFRETYGVAPAAMSDELCQEIRRAVRTLRRSYNASDADPDIYEREANRRAYMIAYYLFYIRPADYVTDRFIAPQISEDDLPGILQPHPQGDAQSGLHLAYFAGGPCPELYGSLAALKKHGYTKIASVHILDREAGWKTELGVTNRLVRRNLGVAPQNLLRVSGCNVYQTCDNHHCNLGTHCQSALYQSADVFYMQNFLSHMPRRNEPAFLSALSQRIDQAKHGAIFAIIDLNYSQVRDVFAQLPRLLQGRADIIDTNYDRGTVNFTDDLTPQSLRTRVFTGEDGLKPRRRTSFYYFVFQKTGKEAA